MSDIEESKDLEDEQMRGRNQEKSQRSYVEYSQERIEAEEESLRGSIKDRLESNRGGESIKSIMGGEQSIKSSKSNKSNKGAHRQIQKEDYDRQEQNDHDDQEDSQQMENSQLLQQQQFSSGLSSPEGSKELQKQFESQQLSQRQESQMLLQEDEADRDEIVRPMTEEAEIDALSLYQKKEQEVINFCKNNNCPWIDKDFPPDLRGLYRDPNKVPEYAKEIRSVKWLRPSEISKDVKFMVDREGDAKQGALGESWLIGVIIIISSKGDLLDRLIVDHQHFDDLGFVTFQFFKNGEWRQVMVDTLLPYDPDQKSLLFAQCANPNEFWVPLMEKAYCKLHGNYEVMCEGLISEGLVDLTGGVSDAYSLTDSFTQKMIESDQLWSLLMTSFHSRFHLGCVNYVEGKGTKNADTGTHGILENHYYGIIEIREFQKEKLRLVRIRNVWGPEGGWNGAFCDDSEEWDKHRNLREELKLVFKTSKKSDGTWWMSYNDWYTHFNKFFIGKVFPENWEIYSIPSKWQGKTAGGPCPPRMQYQESGNPPEFLQLDSDEKWFNNPQFKLKVHKETKIYISLMQEDEKLTKMPYAQCNFMVISNKARRNRIWERPPQSEIIVEANAKMDLPAQREITQQLVLKRFEGKNNGIYMIVPNVIFTTEPKKEEKRSFFLRIFSSDPIEISETSDTLECSMEGTWGDNSSGGKRKYENNKDNPNWCKNPQYFLNLNQSTHLKIILRKTGATRRAKGTKIGMALCRFEKSQSNKAKALLNQPKANTKTGGTNLARLLSQTQQQLEAPEMEYIERKLQIQNEKFKESTYYSEDIAALYFHFNPTEGPFIIIPSLDQEDKSANYKLTIFSNNPVDLTKLDESNNSVLVGKWEQDVSDGGCHLYEDEKDISKRTWTMNPKFLLQFKEDGMVRLSITLCIAEKNWKSKTKNTVGGMIGIYLIEKREGKISIDQVLRQPNFLPINQIKEDFEIQASRNGYYIMPTTYQAKIHGQFILSVQADKEFTLQAIK